MTLAILLASLVAGVALAAWRPPSPAGRRLASRGVLGGLVVLLVLMGARIGANPEVLGRVGTLGFRAVVLAVGAIAGSVALVWPASRWLGGRSHPESRRAAP